MKYRWDKKYLYWGVTIFLVVLASLASIGIIFQFQSLMGTIGWIIGIFEPILYGLVIAFLVNPIVKNLEKLFFRIFRKKIQASPKPKKWRGISRAICIVIAILLVLAALAGLLWMIIPQLIDSITGIVQDFSKYFANLQAWLDDILKNHQDIAGTIEQIIQGAFGFLQKWVATLPDQADNILSGVAGGVMGTISVFTNLILGFIIAIYFLFSKEKFIAQAKKITYAMFKKERANHVIEVGQQTNRMFGGFIIGQILDSLIVGILCFIGMSILGLPFSLLISVIITVTNIIPFFGPFIGGIPSGILILMVNPMQCLYFVILIVVLQQIDGNIICPRFRGNLSWTLWLLGHTLPSQFLAVCLVFWALLLRCRLLPFSTYGSNAGWIHSLKKRKMSLSTETYMESGVYLLKAILRNRCLIRICRSRRK